MKMTKEIKIAFDRKLSEMLAKIAHKNSQIKALKKKIKITSTSNKENFGEIEFDFLGDQRAYYFSMTGWSADFSNFLEMINPPYDSNVPIGFSHQFFMSTLMEERGVYSRSSGKVFLPQHEEKIPELIDNIEICLTNFYIPWIQEFLDASLGIVRKIAECPEFYSYPAPIISYVLNKNSVAWGDLKIPLGKNVIKNKNFDNKLLQHE
jgi:hypothetical protein